ncbi:DsbA family oxidoreductase [Bacillus massiliglaciei]|uniref:DsbA family oxidoreductase n=1 Tax=Bacillus massiliglaciei TaxID=1816693 RepID=UPI000A8BB145|nr:DsbA family oxidoreductase [Bacillus massiliglaciei]
MNVEIWSDYVCPFCYIGKRRFEKALEQFAHKNEVKVEFRSFELDPNSERNPNMSMNELLAQKYGMSMEQVETSQRNLTEQAAAEGLEYHLDQAVMTNTFDAHRLMHYAAAQGKENEMSERLFQAYFTESRHIGDLQTLTELAKEAGLDQAEALKVLEGTEYTAEVRGNEQEGSLLGITGVPFFVINRKYGISGAQPTEHFLATLNKIWAEENPLQMFSSDSDGAGVCTDESCEIPEKE